MGCCKPYTLVEFEGFFLTDLTSLHLRDSGWNITRNHSSPVDERQKTSQYFQRYDRKHGLGLGRKEVVGYGMHKFPLKEIELFEPEVDGNWEEKIDQEISEKIHFLQSFLRSEHLDIPAFLQNEASWLHDAITKSFIVVLNAKSLSLDAIEFEESMRAARLDSKVSQVEALRAQTGRSNYPYMEAEPGELTVEDVERFPSLYKDVVTKYTHLCFGISLYNQNRTISS
ncbi:hypothetical protein D5086_024706 [Populus alba]|uniref:Uncharacterized protein n=1 Tax=Populus alba TaxID=43335 RepID=A0ACC4B682_POPAL